MSTFTEQFGKKSQETHTFKLADATFEVILPATTNKRYQQTMLAIMTVKTPEGDFVVDPDLGLPEMLEAQRAAFAKVCIVSATGFEYDAKNFYAEYPDAVDALFEMASAQVKDEDEVLEASVGKSQRSSTGKKRSAGKRPSPKSSKGKAA